MDVILNNTVLLKRMLVCLDMNDLLRCREVSHKWRLTIDSLKIEGLSVRHPEAILTRTYYFPDFRSVEMDHLFQTTNPDFLQATVMQKLLKNLKRLFIDVYPIVYEARLLKLDLFCENPKLFSFIILLNQLQQLVQLQISHLHLTRKSSLQLAGLKHLSILHLTGQTLKVDCPKLTTFETNFNLHKFQFVYPCRITLYRTEHFEPLVAGFANLEHYWCRNLYTMQPAAGLLKLLPKLKALHCKEDVRIKLLNDLLSAKRKLRRLDFEIIYAGLRIKNRRDLNDLTELSKSRAGFLFSVDESFPIFLENYEKLADSSYIHTVNYSSLIENKRFCCTINLDRFFGRFVAIRKVEVNGPVDEQKFVKFIRRCDSLRILELHNAGLDPEFYHTLPDYQPHIAGLAISESFDLFLDFLFKFQSLVSFFVKQLPEHFDFIDAFDLPRFKMFCFATGKKEFQIFENRNGRFELVMFKNESPPVKVAVYCKHRMLNFLGILRKLIKE